MAPSFIKKWHGKVYNNKTRIEDLPTVQCLPVKVTNLLTYSLTHSLPLTYLLTHSFMYIGVTSRNECEAR